MEKSLYSGCSITNLDLFVLFAIYPNSSIQSILHMTLKTQSYLTKGTTSGLGYTSICVLLFSTKLVVVSPDRSLYVMPYCG